jgi:hypothetical protein
MFELVDCTLTSHMSMNLPTFLLKFVGELI